jgi:hypothetical protein
VALNDTAVRPGMAVVRKVPDGSHLMSYEKDATLRHNTWCQ